VATSAIQSAKATGDFQPYFHHTEGTFGFVVCKGQVRFPKESQNAIVESLQPIQQVLGFGLLGALFGALLRRKGIGSAASLKDFPIWGYAVDSCGFLR
jgi:hypothetical protein